jgi:hypothetical protein
MKWILAVLVAGTIAAISAEAQPDSRYRYLMDAANRIIELSEATSVPTSEALEGAASFACRALGRLLEDPAFRADLNKIAKGSTYAAERSALRRDLALFSSAFISWEEDALVRAGLSPTAARKLLIATAYMSQAVDDAVEPTRVITAIESARIELCAGTTRIARAQDTSQRRQLALTWALRLGGAAIIVGNAAVATPSGGFALASVAIGAGIMSWDARR